MQASEAIIERVWRVAAGVQRLELAVEPSLAQIEPGQSLLVLGESYLREQWIPIESQGGQLVVERHAEAHYSPGQVVDAIGPIGKALPWVGGGGKHLLLIAQDTPPTPLLMLAQSAAAQTAEVALVLLGKARGYPFEGIPAAVELLSGNDNNAWDDQASTLQWADQIFAVADDAFWDDYFSSLVYLVKKTLGAVPANFLHGVFTLPLPCGVGACDACMVRCKTNNKLICKQGPSLDLSEVFLI